MPTTPDDEPPAPVLRQPAPIPVARDRTLDTLTYGIRPFPFAALAIQTGANAEAMSTDEDRPDGVLNGQKERETDGHDFDPLVAAQSV